MRVLKLKSFITSFLRFALFSILPFHTSGRLGASINLFDGEELLLDLIYSVRSEVDYLSVVYQDTGHWGENHANPHLARFLSDLKSLGLIDEFFLWDKSARPLNVNEFNSLDMLKREKGLELARENGCSHFLNLDNDELYTRRGLRYMKRIMMRSSGIKFDYSVLRHLQYYRNASLILKNKEQEYVMGIFPIKRDTAFEYAAESRFPIDPGRKISGSKVIEFWRFEVCMHHMSYVRKDIRTKLVSSHARDGNLPILEKIVERYETYAFPQQAYWGHGLEVELKRIRPKVSLKYFESDAFEKYVSGNDLGNIIQS